MKKCPQCDKRYDDSQKFCSDCGVELTDLSWDEQNQLIADEQKTKTKKMGIIVVACVVVLAIAIGAAVMMYPKMQVKNAIAGLEDELNRAIYVTECDIFTLPEGTKSSVTMGSGHNYSIDGTYVLIEQGYLDMYFVKMDGLKVHHIYDYDIYAKYEIQKQFNDIYLDIAEEYIDLIGTDKIKTVKV